MNAEEILKAISSINDDIYKSFGDDDFPCLKYTTNEFYEVVEMNDFTLWCSEDDTRKYDDALRRDETMEECLRRELRTIIKNLTKIKV